MHVHAVDARGVSATDRAEARRYRMMISWSDEDAAFLVSVPGAPGVVTHGATPEAAAA